MADLLTAAGGQLVAEAGTTLTAQFDCPERALNAARRLHRALYAFTATPETAGFAASIVIHKPEDSLRTDPGLSVPHLLWSEFAAPGQILVSGSAHEILQFIPGVQFRDVAIEERGGPAYREMLWIDPEALEAWRARVEEASRLVASVKREQESAEPVAEAEVLPADSPIELAGDEHEGQFELASPGGPNRQRLLWIASAMLLAVVVTVGVVSHLRSGHPNAVGTTQTLAQEPKTSAIAPQPVVNKPEASGNGKPSEEHEVEAKTKAAEANAHAKPRQPNREVEGGVAQYEGFTTKQIPQLIKKAEEDAGKGDYASAKWEYEIVLRLQPGNAAAKEGLRKLSLKIEQR